MTEVRRATPVKWWAGLGAAFVALQLYVYAAWLLSGPSRTSPGPVEQPGYMDIGAAFMNVGMPIGAAYILVRYVILPWRRDGRPSTEGLFALALACVAWQDPLVNYVQVVSTYNANLWNLGSWGEHVPGWMSPNAGDVAEPIAGWIPAYLFTGFMIVLLTDRVMHGARARWPRIGTFGLLSVNAGFNFAIGLVSELFALVIGLYTYGGAIQVAVAVPRHPLPAPDLRDRAQHVPPRGFRRPVPLPQLPRRDPRRAGHRRRPARRDGDRRRCAGSPSSAP